MFPTIDTTLGNRLGILNWKRFDICREWAARAALKDTLEEISEDGPSETTDHETAPTTSMADTSTGHDTSLNTATNLDTEITAPNNDFDDHFEPHPGKSGRRDELDLETVLTSSTQLAGTFRIPDIPNKDQNGNRTCSVCMEHLNQSVQTRIDWKRHVYYDLAPYTCTSPDCATRGVDTFRNRKDWAEHEFQHHLSEKVWLCSACSARLSTREAFSSHLERNHPEYTWVEEHVAVELSENTSLHIKSPLICPMCKVTLEPSLQVYARHVGKHLEQIALIVVQIQNIDESLDDDEIGTETTSSIGYPEDDEAISSLEHGDNAAVMSSLEHGDDATELDIIAVHGLDADPTRTWTSRYDEAPIVSSTRNFENAAISPKKKKTRGPIMRKVAVIGSRNTGKSSLIVQFMDGHYLETYYPTIENTYIKTMRRGRQEYGVEIVDAAGQDEYSILNSKHFMGVHGYMIVYSVRSLPSFEMVQVIREKILNHLGTDWVPMVVVGNESESQSELRQVSTEDGRRLCEKWNCAWTEASARYDENVTKAFEMLISEVEKSHNPGESASNRCITM
ncbi:GTP-binding protein [Neopestalotiopsis sp. 37M]|nr:GTP-binding protein [Neopestalotiopsis sp. 37M]